MASSPLTLELALGQHQLGDWVVRLLLSIHVNPPARPLPDTTRQARQPLMTIPNVLTFFRLLLVPVLLLVWELQVGVGRGGVRVHMCVRNNTR